MSIEENTKRLIAVFHEIFQKQPMVQRFSTKAAYKTMPMMTDEVVAGIPLRSIIAPPVEGCDLDKQGYFDIYIENLKDGCDPARDLPEDLGLVAKRLGVVGVMCSLGQDRLWVKDGTMIAMLDTLQFGVQADKVKSNFYNGKPLEIGDVYERVAISRRVKSRRGRLCSALATVRSDTTGQAERIMLALRVGNPAFDYSQLILDTLANVPGGKADLDTHRLFDICMRMGMPIRRLNDELVPKHLTQAQFDEAFTPEFKARFRNWRENDRAFLFDYVKGLTTGKLAIESELHDAETLV